ncbi:MAG: RNA polymerase sigma factor [Planctomycetota bacterium]|nr:MAG: RNA polymerase sigma factor [Planctomycetota bacterium]
MMGSGGDYIELVRTAQLGDEGSLNRLAEAARERLRVYVYRLTLEDEKTEDIVQESMLEMFKVLGKLKKADRFWPWLYGIAINKTHRHHRSERRQRRAQDPRSGYEGGQREKQEGLEKLVSSELKQVVSAAMRTLAIRQRAVLAMRCYDDMSYSEIGEAMGCSEFAARMLFCRAKRALQKQLSRRGLGRGALLTVLAVFGKLTADSEAAAAGVSVTSGTIKVGAAAGAAVLATSKAVIVPVVTAGALAVGTMVVTSQPDKSMAEQAEQVVRHVEAMSAVDVDRIGEGEEEYWYYWPKGVGGPVMMRVMRTDRGGKSYCAVRQNEKGNYYYDRGEGTMYIRNRRIWRGDLGVWRLPTDGPELSGFISAVEGETAEMDYIRGRGEGLLVITRRGVEEVSNGLRVIRHYNVLEEEYFRYSLPVGIEVVDERDAMRRRGWTCFRVTGEINGKEITGGGRIPFVYEAAEQYGPWLRLKVGERLEIVDSDRGASIYDAEGKLSGRYARGSFFRGLGRPWMGLHTIDTVRRDAAEQGMRFETRLTGGNNAEIKVSGGEGELVYTIDMARDVVEKIRISSSNGWDAKGEIRFEYLEGISGVGEEFVRPRRGPYRGRQEKSIGMRWLMRLTTN